MFSVLACIVLICLALGWLNERKIDVFMRCVEVFLAAKIDVGDTPD